MRNFDRGQRGGGGRSFGRRDSGGGRSFDRPREMHKVICSECGKETEVPFRPTGDRPVYCRDCFAKQGGRDSRGPRPSFERREERRETPDNSAQLDAINSKLDQLIRLLTPSQSSGQAPKGESKAVEQVPQEEKSEAPAVIKTRSASSGREKKRVSKKAPEATEEV